MKKKGFSLVLVLVFTGLIIFLVIGYSFFNTYIKNTENKPQNVNEQNFLLPQDPENPTKEWKSYTNSDYKFSLKYPKEFALKEDGPNGINSDSTAAAKLAGTPAATLNTISFTDSNKRVFTLNIFAKSEDPNANTTVANLYEFSGVCGMQGTDRTLVKQVLKEGDLEYKVVIQSQNGRTLSDYCFFTPQGNLLVLRNNSSSTEITMKLILSTFQFTK